MKLLGRLLDGLMDFALIALGIPAAITESTLNRRSWTDRIADRVVERMQAGQLMESVNNLHQTLHVLYGNHEPQPSIYEILREDQQRGA